MDPRSVSSFIAAHERISSRQAKQTQIAALPEQAAIESDCADIYQVSRGELLVADTWRCVRKIALGSTSAVYLAYSVDYEKEAAIKVSSFSRGDDLLGLEAQALLNLKDGPGIPRLYWFGKGALRNFLVMELLGPSLLDLLVYCDGRFTLKTVCMLAVQIFEILDWVHRNGYIHREINPQNFCIGSGPTSRHIFLIDYATVIKFRRKVMINGEETVPRVVGTRQKGHALYDSIASHRGNERSYRDDAESAVYMLLHFLISDLPWRGAVMKTSKLPGAPQEKSNKFEAILQIKECSAFSELAPPEIQFALDHVRSLKYEELPDYELLIHLFLSLLHNEGQTFDYHYDWLTKTSPEELQDRARRKRNVLARLVDPLTGKILALQTHRHVHHQDSMDDLLHDTEDHHVTV